MLMTGFKCYGTEAAGKPARYANPQETGKIIVAYVTSWSDVMPNPRYMTHINYAFGHVNKTCDGIHIANEPRLRQILALKQQKPGLKIMLSIGGWGSGGFSEMAADNEQGDLQRTVYECLAGQQAVQEKARSHTMSQEEYPGNYAHGPRFKALIYYTEHAEEAHMQFAKQTIEFFKKLNYGQGFNLDITTDFSQYSYEKLQEYSVIIMPNGYPMQPHERAAFEKYMENGGGWMGFHAAAYNDKNTNWPWFVTFLGNGVFYCNNWPPQPVLLETDKQHPVTNNLPESFVAPASEWYMWTPSPRCGKNIEVLLSISPKNYPLGIKDVVKHGDFPVVWTNRKYRMIYLNMGHGDEEYQDATQKLLFINAFRWIVSTDRKGNPFE